MRDVSRALFLIVVCAILTSGCGNAKAKSVPHAQRWGIYELNLATQEVKLMYGSAGEIATSTLGLNSQGDTLVFAQKIDGDSNERAEICTIGVDGKNFKRVTNNSSWDLYPVWSPDGKRIAFLSLRRADFDIYVMDADGRNERRLFDSGSHDADIHWSARKIVFTAKSQVWMIGEDGTPPVRITNPPKAGQWGKANLPFGDYDPRLSPDGKRIVFERLEGDTSPHGNYNIYVVNADGSGATRLTDTGYSQGLASWSHSSAQIVYTVAAIRDQGKYDLYMMNADGTQNRSVTPSYFPDAFLCHAAIFSKDDSRIFFIGEWWE
ncbi:MAG: hypothetical protein AB1817_10290 [Chloroflexota bacterium]